MIIDGENTELNTVSVYVLDEDDGFKILRPSQGQYCADISRINNQLSDTGRESPSSDNDNAENGHILEQRLKIIGKCRKVFLSFFIPGQGRIKNSLPTTNE